MGAIWDFIAGKSNDWDRVDRENAEYAASHPIIKYKAYCRICGETGGSEHNLESTPSGAIRYVQNSFNGCGRNCHEPVVQEVKR